MIHEVCVSKVLPDAEIEKLAGKHVEVCDESEWHVLHPDGLITHVRRGDGSLLCAIRRKAINPMLCALAVECYREVGEQVSTNRGYAAGIITREQREHYQRGAPAQTGIIGYIDSANSKYPCRLTQFCRKHFAKYQKGLPFIERMDQLMKELVPEQHALQKRAADRAVDHEGASYAIQGTAFSTVTVNKDFRTALHVDSGDYREGFGTIAVISDAVSGGWFLFPQYRVALVLESGDFAAVDVHEWHCNTPITKHTVEGYRLSFIAYFRERLMQCWTINRRLSLVQKTCTSAELLHDIFGRDVEKQVLEDARWWKMEDESFLVVYRGKRYLFTDKLKNKTIHNLWPAWEYVRETYQNN